MNVPSRLQKANIHRQKPCHHCMVGEMNVSMASRDLNPNALTDLKEIDVGIIAIITQSIGL
jgi:hypothetical protein